MNFFKWYKKNTQNLEGKTIVLTGATGGLGKQAMTHLVKLNANIVMACRNLEKAESLKNTTIPNFPNACIEIISLDTSKNESIQLFVQRLIEKHPNGIDYFINNAGTYNVENGSADAVFQTNFLGPMTLTLSLLKYLNQKKCKIINVGSLSQFFQKMNFEDISFSKCKKTIKVYGNSKRWIFRGTNFLQNLTYEKFPNITINFVHPGVSATNLFAKKNGKAVNAFYGLVLPIMKFIFPSPQKASLNLVKSLFEDTSVNEWIGPKGLFSVWGKPQKRKFKDKYPDEQTKFNCFMQEKFKDYLQ